MILVTGATGTVGSETVRQLADAHHKVRALVHDPAKATTLGQGVEVAVGDYDDPRTLTAAFANVERVFVICPVTPQLETFEANVYRAAAEAGAKHIVKLSNLAAGKLKTSLWHWHEGSENRLRALGTPFTILRPARFMTDTPFSWGPIAEQGVIVEASGDGANVLTDPHDVAAVAARVLTTPGHEGQTYSLTAAEALTGAQIAQKISQVLDRPVTYTDISPETMSESLLAAGMPPYVVEVARDYFHMVRQGRLHPTTTIAELLGRPPRTYDEWLRENASTRMRQHGAPKPV